VQEVFKETLESSSAKILQVIQAKQEAGLLDLSDTSSAAVRSILTLQEDQQIIDQSGLDATALAKIEAISSSVAKVVAQIETSVVSGGIAVLTNANTASSIANLVATVNTSVTDLITDVISVADFETIADIDRAGCGGRWAQ
jgi:hypothetical protein